MSDPILVVARPQDVGPALRDLRRSTGKRLIDVAEAMGIHNITNMSAWERGIIHPRVGTLVNLLDVHDYVMVFMQRDSAIRLLRGEP